MTDDSGDRPTQTTVQDSWPDGSVRWLLVESTIARVTSGLRLSEGGASSHPLRVSASGAGWVVDTGIARVSVERGGVLGITRIETAAGGLDLSAGALTLTGEDGAAAAVTLTDVGLRRQGAAAATFEFRGAVAVAGKPVTVFGEIDVFAGAAVARLRVTVGNPSAADHPNGHFDLGGSTSVRFRELALRVPTESSIGVTLDCGDGSSYSGTSVRLHQESSGGERWNHHTHLDATRQVPLTYRGYRAFVDGEEHSGLRASPILSASSQAMTVAVAVPRFWQNFPKALAAEGGAVHIALFPQMERAIHELQGGEQKTHDIVIDFAAAAASTEGGQALSWARAPRLVHASPDYYASTGVIAGMVPKNRSTSPGYERLVDSAIQGPDSFDNKREAVDEYGWRHYGDIWGDHEAVFYAGDDAPLVSHYNNQYDPVQGFAFQFLRSGDVRWWRHMDELAAHVADIDVYHTSADKSAYNHGLFWHTVHYIDADTSTHRAYPKRGSGGGGPSGGHLYPSGLMLHSYLTGSRISRATALELAEYVISCDDGRLTFMKWLSRAPTGVASASGSEHYHGPGRAPGNSLNALLEGWKATGDARYARKIDELLRRVFHPATDIAPLNLLDAENKWFYMMYAHSLGKYLDWCVEAQQQGETYEYARACFLHLTRWAAAHERPYLEKPDELEYPTETWAAQDMRKCDVFLAAARHAADEAERQRFLERARFFFDYSVSALEGFETRALCRPVVLLLSFGWRWFGDGDGRQMPALTALPSRDWGRPAPFVAQKPQFLKRAKLLVAAGAAVFLLLCIVGLSLWLR